MSSPAAHRVVDAGAHRIPKPFRSLAVRSEEPAHANVARAPARCVHVVRLAALDAVALRGLAALGWARVRVDAFSDIAYAPVALAELAAAAPGVADLVALIAHALRATGVLGEAAPAYRQAVAGRIDYLACRGAGFHNDVDRHWPRCLFWNLALDVADVEFVMPHAGVRVALVAGELMLFDPAMAHGVCRPRDAGEAVAESFAGLDASRQLFLSGELLLDDAQWAALGAPWLPVQAPERRDALDLMVAEFDERSAAIKRPSALRHCMQPVANAAPACPAVADGAIGRIGGGGADDVPDRRR